MLSLIGNLSRKLAPGAGLLLCALPLQAIEITYELTDLGGGDYAYGYTVTNDGTLGAGVAVEWFDLLFDPALYDEGSLVITTSSPLAVDWDEQLFGSAPGWDALYDAYAQAGGIADGSSQAGFSIQFTWLGTGRPGAQPFEIYDPDTFALLESGTTQDSQVPLPGTLALMMLGLGLVGVRFKTAFTDSEQPPSM